MTGQILQVYSLPDFFEVSKSQNLNGLHVQTLEQIYPVEYEGPQGKSFTMPHFRVYGILSGQIGDDILRFKQKLMEKEILGIITDEQRKELRNTADKAIGDFETEVKQMNKEGIKAEVLPGVLLLSGEREP